MPTNELGTQAQLTNTAAAHICLEDGQRVVFDNIITGSEDIDYDPETGGFELGSSGAYLVNWGVAVDGSYAAPFARFALEIDGLVGAAAAVPVTLGRVNSTDLVTVDNAPASLALINNTGDVVCLANVSPAAGIVISKIPTISSEDALENALSEVIHSIAQEENALAHIMSAEAEKILAAIKIPEITVKELLCLNNSVRDTLESIVRLEGFLAAKLKTALEKGKEC